MQAMTLATNTTPTFPTLMHLQHVAALPLANYYINPGKQSYLLCQLSRAACLFKCKQYGRTSCPGNAAPWREDVQILSFGVHWKASPPRARGSAVQTTRSAPSKSSQSYASRWRSHPATSSHNRGNACPANNREHREGRQTFPKRGLYQLRGGARVVSLNDQ